MTSEGQVAYFKLTEGVSHPQGLAASSDGYLWFSESNGNKIGRFGIEGGLMECPIPTEDSRPEGIAVAPDRSVWFAEAAANKIGHLVWGGD